MIFAILSHFKLGTVVINKNFTTDRLPSITTRRTSATMCRTTQRSTIWRTAPRACTRATAMDFTTSVWVPPTWHTGASVWLITRRACRKSPTSPSAKSGRVRLARVCWSTIRLISRKWRKSTCSTPSKSLKQFRAKKSTTLSKNDSTRWIARNSYGFFFFLSFRRLFQIHKNSYCFANVSFCLLVCLFVCLIFCWDSGEPTSSLKIPGSGDASCQKFPSGRSFRAFHNNWNKDFIRICDYAPVPGALELSCDSTAYVCHKYRNNKCAIHPEGGSFRVRTVPAPMEPATAKDAASIRAVTAFAMAFVVAVALFWKQINTFPLVKNNNSVPLFFL